MPEEAKKKEVWSKFLNLAKERIPKSSFQTWVQPASLKKLSLESQEIKLEVKNQFSKNLIIQNYYKIILEIFQELLQTENLSLNIEVNNELQIKSKNYTPSLSALIDTKNQKTSSNRLKKEKKFNLDPRFSFEDFIVGPHNQFAHAVALSVAHNFPKLVYNPFFIYGDVGLGKTHLMQSIGNYIQKKINLENQDFKILYITAEKFLNDLIENMKKNQMNNFRAKYRSVNLLLIDDIQFIEGKEATQEEFFHTFNALKDSKRQVILTSDRPPSAIPRLEKRLQSRFEAGLIVDVQAPSYETRIAIIQKKSVELDLELTADLIEFLAENLTSNIRTTEGILNKIQAYTSFTCTKPNLEMIQKIIKFNQPKLKEHKQTNKQELIEKISKIVSEELGIDFKRVIDPENTQREVLEARHLSITLSRWGGISLTKLKDFFNKQNSSLLNSINRVEKKSKEDPKFSKFVKDLYDRTKEL